MPKDKFYPKQKNNKQSPTKTLTFLAAVFGPATAPGVDNQIVVKSLLKNLI